VLTAVASHLVSFPILCASNPGDIGALGMEESAADGLGGRGVLWSL